MKCIEDEIPFDIPDGWCWCRLSMVGFTNIGLTYKPSDIINDGTIVLRSCNIRNGKIDLDDLVRVQSDIRDNQYIKKNDILICARNGSRALVGKCAIMDDIGEKVSFGAFMAVFRSICYRYIYHYFNTALFRSSFDNDDSKQINQVTQSILRDTMIPLPPFTEQRHITDTLDNMFNYVELVDAKVKNVENLIENTKSKILDLAIRGKLVPQDLNDEPASVLLERIRAEKEELIKQGKIKRDKKESVIFKGDDNSYYHHIENGAEVYDKLIVLPSGWVPCTISDCSYNIGNKENQIKTNEISKKGEFPVVSQSQEYVDGYCDMNEKVINDIPVILFGDHTRVVKYIDFPFVIGADGTKIHKIIRINEKYFYYWMKYTSGLIESKGYSRHYSALKKSCFFLPPLAEQKRIVEAIETLFAQIDKIAEQIS